MRRMRCGRCIAKTMMLQTHTMSGVKPCGLELSSRYCCLPAAHTQQPRRLPHRCRGAMGRRVKKKSQGSSGSGEMARHTSTSSSAPAGGAISGRALGSFCHPDTGHGTLAGAATPTSTPTEAAPPSVATRGTPAPSMSSATCSPSPSMLSTVRICTMQPDAFRAVGATKFWRAWASARRLHLHHGFSTVDEAVCYWTVCFGQVGWVVLPPRP